MLGATYQRRSCLLPYLVIDVHIILSIIFHLKDPENIPSPNLDIFFTTISSLRSQHGIPINLIVMSSSPGGLGNRLSTLRQPSFCGGIGGGVMQKNISMPLPEDQLGE